MTTVAVMAFNEEQSLIPTVHELLAVMRRQSEPFEVLIIDDGSRDATGLLAEQVQAEHPEVRVARHPINQGLGGVYRTAFSLARGDWLTFIPADGQFPAENLIQFLSCRQDCALVLGHLPNRPDGLVARLLSEVERWLYRLLFGFFPRFQGLWMVRTDVLRSLPLKSTGRGWSIVMEVILRIVRAGHAYRSIPNTCRPRQFGHSKVRNWRTIWTMLRELVRLRWVMRGER